MATQHNDSIAAEIFESGLHTQLLGVTAGVFGFIVFLLANLNYTVEDGLGPIKKYGLPIIIAYGITFLTIIFHGLFKSWRCWATLKATLWYIYVVFICGDVALLGWLVWLTGGTRNSIFMPIFLLIPTIATCYCNPRKGFFWIVTVATIAVFVALSFFIPASLQPPLNLSNVELIYLNLLNILGICTVAFCYFRTNRIRSDYCKEKLNHSDNCRNLYL